MQKNSKVDLRKVYIQICMHPDDIPKASFGSAEFLRFLFCLHLWPSLERIAASLHSMSSLHSTVCLHSRSCSCWAGGLYQGLSNHNCLKPIWGWLLFCRPLSRSADGRWPPDRDAPAWNRFPGTPTRLFARPSWSMMASSRGEGGGGGCGGLLSKW